jgi:hypothetical protein
MHDTILSLQLLKLNVLPPYAEDDDEGQRDPEDYESFYKEQVERAIQATHRYLASCQAMTRDPTSHASWTDYVVARRAFVQSLPFCYDTSPDASNPQYAEVRRFIVEFFSDRRNQDARESAMTALARFADLLARYSTALGQ